MPNGFNYSYINIHKSILNYSKKGINYCEIKKIVCYSLISYNWLCKEIGHENK